MVATGTGTLRGWLVLDEPGGARHRLPGPGDPPVLVGRGGGNAVRVPDDDTLASRTHAEVAWSAAGRWRVGDLCSAHGTIVDDRRVGAAELVEGSVLQIGQSVFVVHVEGT